MSDISFHMSNKLTWILSWDIGMFLMQCHWFRPMEHQHLHICCLFILIWGTQLFLTPGGESWPHWHIWRLDPVLKAALPFDVCSWARYREEERSWRTTLEAPHCPSTRWPRQRKTQDFIGVCKVAPLPLPPSPLPPQARKVPSAVQGNRSSPLPQVR